MTVFAFSSYPTNDQPYALFSADARAAQRQIVTSAPPPGSPTPTIIKTIELREQPFAPLTRQIDTFAALDEDWDSYGAARVAAVALATARTILRDLSLRAISAAENGLVPFSVAPIATGGVKLEWRRADRALELWVDEEGNIDLLIDQPRQEQRFFEKTLSGIPSAIHEVLAFAA